MPRGHFMRDRIIRISVRAKCLMLVEDADQRDLADQLPAKRKEQKNQKKRRDQKLNLLQGNRKLRNHHAVTHSLLKEVAAMEVNATIPILVTRMIRTTPKTFMTPMTRPAVGIAVEETALVIDAKWTKETVE